MPISQIKKHKKTSQLQLFLKKFTNKSLDLEENAQEQTRKATQISTQISKHSLSKSKFY